MSSRLKFGVVVAVAMSLLVGAQVQAASVTAVISDILDKMEGGPPVDHVNPIVFEDDDASELVDMNANGFGDPGDIVRGIIDFPAIWAGNPQDTLDPTVVGKSELLTPRRILDTGGLVDGVANELTGVFEMEVLPGSTPALLLLGPVTSHPITLLSAPTPGTMIQIFEDAANNFTITTSLAADAPFAKDGTLFAELGMTGVGTEFYHITPVVAGAIELVTYSLNFTTLPPPLIAPWNPPTMEPWVNSLGTKTYGTGTLTAAGTSGTSYQRLSDIDNIILYAPVPAAFGPGIALLGVLGLVYRRRRRA